MQIVGEVSKLINLFVSNQNHNIFQQNISTGASHTAAVCLRWGYRFSEAFLTLLLDVTYFRLKSETKLEEGKMQHKIISRILQQTFLFTSDILQPTLSNPTPATCKN